MARFRSPPPLWFRAVAVVLVLWGAMGCYAWYMQFRFGPDSWGPGVTQWDRDFYADLPTWYNVVYGFAVLGGVFGAVALLLRSVLAIPLFWISLVGIVAMFGYTFVATDLIAHKGVLVATGFPILIAAIAAFQIWLARFARARGWIG